MVKVEGKRERGREGGRVLTMYNPEPHTRKRSLENPQPSSHSPAEQLHEDAPRKSHGLADNVQQITSELHNQRREGEREGEREEGKGGGRVVGGREGGGREREREGVLY